MIAAPRHRRVDRDRILQEVEILLDMLASALTRDDEDAMLFAATMLRARMPCIEGNDDPQYRSAWTRASELLCRSPTRLVGLAAVQRFMRRFGTRN